jgi:thiosulfate reductase cytochrome b subunit
VGCANYLIIGGAAPINGGQIIMKEATKRSIFRWIHIIFAIPILGYIYSPFEKLPDYAPATRFVFLPVMVLSGLWMWKGHVLRQLISKRSAQQDVT